MPCSNNGSTSISMPYFLESNKSFQSFLEHSMKGPHAEKELNLSLYIHMQTYSHNVKEKETEFGHVSVTGVKKKNKHMFMVSDTSFSSNNLKNVCFIFKTKFCWHSLDAAVEIFSPFLKEKTLHDRVTPLQQNRKSLYLCTEFILQQDVLRDF